jgi:hypothetical protein
MACRGWSSATLAAALVAAGCALAPSAAVAEIYGWVDPSGAVTYSNLPPPKNARVIDVIEETPPPTPQAQAAAEAAHQAEMRALNEKVRQLEQEMQQSRYQSAPAPPPYPVAAPPSYGPPPSYASYGPACDPELFDCAWWAAGPAYYTIGVLPWWGFHRHHDHDHDRDRGDRFDHGFHRFPHPVGGPHFVGAPHAVAAPRAVGAPRSSGGSSAHGSGRSSSVSGPMARAH